MTLLLLYCCLTSTEAKWPMKDGDRVGRGRQSEGSTAETVRKRPERPWTSARTMEVLRRCPLAIAQRLVHCAIALSAAVLDRVTKTMSVAPLLTNKTGQALSFIPPRGTGQSLAGSVRLERRAGWGNTGPVTRASLLSSPATEQRSLRLPA